MQNDSMNMFVQMLAVIVVGVSPLFSADAMADNHANLAREFVKISELNEDVNATLRIVDVRIAFLKKRPGCEKGTECRKALDNFERQHVASKDKYQKTLIEQSATHLKTKFNEKELEWLLSVYKLPTFTKFKSYYADGSARPGTKLSDQLNEKLDKEVVQKYLGTSGSPKPNK